MARWPGAEPIYEVADTFRTRCLSEHRSLRWPEHQAWTKRNLDAIWDAFVEHPNLGKETFLQKWKGQLQDQSKDVHRIAADVVALYYLFPGNVGPERKKAAVQEALSWKLGEEGTPPGRGDVFAAFDNAIGHGGIYYSTGQPQQITFYLQFARKVLADDGDPFDLESSRHLADQVRAE